MCAALWESLDSIFLQDALVAPSETNPRGQCIHGQYKPVARAEYRSWGPARRAALASRAARLFGGGLCKADRAGGGFNDGRPRRMLAPGLPHSIGPLI